MSNRALEATKGFLSNNFAGAGSTSYPGKEPLSRDFGQAALSSPTQTVSLDVTHDVIAPS